MELFEYAASRAKTNVILKLHLLLCTLLMMTSVFVTALECLYAKPQSHVLKTHIFLISMFIDKT